MKLTHFSLFIIGIILASCNPAIKPDITGTIVNNDKIHRVEIRDLESGKYEVLDSTAVKDNNFNFNLSLKSPKLIKVKTNDSKAPTARFFYEPNLNYKLNFDGDSISIDAPENSLQQRYSVLLKELQPLNKKLLEVSRDTTLTKQELDSLSTMHYMNLVQHKKNYIKKHPKSYISLFLLQDMVSREALSYHEQKALFKIVMNDANKKSPLLDFVDTRLKEIEANRMIGTMAPSFLLKDPKGKEYTLEDFKGGYTLVDFWASWCAPCRVANRKITPLYNKYKDKGFKIVSISFDDDKEKWVKAIEEDQIPWVQVSDLKGFNASEIKKLYKVKTLPTTYVLNPEGKVVDQHLKHNELEKLLEEIYN
jgi:thiol-disulfide isomerase/thioredoxin